MTAEAFYYLYQPGAERHPSYWRIEGGDVFGGAVKCGSCSDGRALCPGSTECTICGWPDQYERSNGGAPQ